MSVQDALKEATNRIIVSQKRCVKWHKRADKAQNYLRASDSCTMARKHPKYGCDFIYELFGVDDHTTAQWLVDTMKVAPKKRAYVIDSYKILRIGKTWYIGLVLIDRLRNPYTLANATEQTALALRKTVADLLREMNALKHVDSEEDVVDGLLDLWFGFDMESYIANPMKAGDFDSNPEKAINQIADFVQAFVADAIPRISARVSQLDDVCFVDKVIQARIERDVF